MYRDLYRDQFFENILRTVDNCMSQYGPGVSVNAHEEHVFGDRNTPDDDDMLACENCFYIVTKLTDGLCDDCLREANGI